MIFRIKSLEGMFGQNMSDLSNGSFSILRSDYFNGDLTHVQTFLDQCWR